MSGEPNARQELVERKLGELAAQQHRLHIARTALEHGLRCPAGDPMQCSRFWTIIDGRQHGFTVEQSHARAH